MELEALGDREYEGMIVLQDKLPAAQVALKSAHWMSKEEVSNRLAAEFPSFCPADLSRRTSAAETLRSRSAAPRLRHDLNALEGSNRQRAQRLVQWLATQPERPVSELTTAAVFERMRDWSQRHRSPSAESTAASVATSAASTGSGTSSCTAAPPVALAATVRTAGPLVGAALDRLAHGHAVAGTAPLDLASRAELAMRIAGNEDGWHLHNLLGT